MEKKGVIWAVNLYNIFLRNIHHGVQFVIFLPKNILGHKYFFSMKDLSLFEFSTLFTADLAGQLLLLCVKRVRKLAESLLCSLLHLFFPASWARELREKFKKKQNKLISILFLTHLTWNNAFGDSWLNSLSTFCLYFSTLRTWEILIITS